MEAKLRQLMKHEGVNSTRLAEILGIQASGISHIMSGRNKPSFDFLLKLLQRFPQINPDWLILDKGPMYRDEIKNKNQSPPSGTAIRTAGTGSLPVRGDSVAPVGTGGSDIRGTGSGGGFMVAGLPGGGLFAPDNEDIIRPGDNRWHSGGDPGRWNAGTRGHSDGRVDYTADSGGQTESQSVAQVWQAGPSTSSQARQTGSPAEPQTMDGERQATPQSYQAGDFIRSASIERIVVFYKDKTFSEYKPG